uniref:NADH dehydrogenase subunit 6 n=1 Tax=Allothyrus sp. LamingtonNP-QMS95173 TaxID=1442165 RepID=W0FHR6_9ACAR|nr:NADH dehydrogenase subunit 6 [Allothyrus sp. LamingtonNP-QMS95173]
MKLLFMISSLFLISSHPLMMIIMIILMTLYISSLMFMISKFSWMSFILILVMLGGMLILFIYIASLASNELFNLNNKMIPLILMMMMIIPWNFYNKIITPMNLNNFFFSYSSLNIFMIIMYLLLSLIIIINIIKSSKSPLRSN